MHITTVRANQNKTPCADVMEINHCREGRFECEFANGDAAYLGVGDLAVNMLIHPTRDSWFPLSHYHGISVVVDLYAAQDTLRRVGEALNSAPVDLFALRDRLCGANTCFIIRATDAIQHIFSELYTAPSAIQSDYCKLKVLELLLFLNSGDLPSLREKRAYITRKQADTVRSIRAGRAFRPAYHASGVVRPVRYSANYSKTKLQNGLWRYHRRLYKDLPNAKGHVSPSGNKPEHHGNCGAGGLSERQQVF